jgi:hypothetical protein
MIKATLLEIISAIQAGIQERVTKTSFPLTICHKLILSVD